MPAFTPVRLVLCLFGLVLLSARAQIPAAVRMDETRRQEILHRLTSVESVLDAKAIPVAAGDSGVVLLREFLVVGDESGRRTIVNHYVYKALTDAGIESVGNESFDFRNTDQKGYVLLAETIHPDGTHQSVSPDAILLQTPQREADYSIYNDTKEVKVIFPKVSVGSVTHVIYAVTDEKSRFPGQFYFTAYLGSGSWATGRQRYLVDIPASVATRLQLSTIGSAVPPPAITKRNDGRVTYEWQTVNIPGVTDEIARAPMQETGPVTHLSTIPTWDDVGRWYRGLMSGRDQVGPALAKEADSWTAQAKTPAEIIAAVHAKIANDVRYVGLELGESDFRPHDCNQTWELRYGDCKDKANLLAALLRRRGIDAHIALLNTDHAGFVDRHAPDYRSFSHAIVAIKQPGGYLFCDPTISYSRPGLLSPSDSNRDALVVLDNGAQWVHTPDSTAGTYDYQFDLKLALTGELSGWLTVTADGYYGAASRAAYTRLDADEMRSDIANEVTGFFKGAQLIDVARDEKDPERYRWKAYFILPPKSDGSDGRATIVFPNTGGLFVDVGDKPERETTFFKYRERTNVTVTIEVPQNLAPEKLPGALQVKSDAFTGEARWTFGGGRCVGTLTMMANQSLLSPSGFRQLFQSTHSLQAWLAQPVLLSAKSGSAAPVAEATLDLPLMATGQGQIDLVDRRYPDSGNVALRRAALERTLQYFPGDPVTAFRASVRIVLLDWSAGATAQAHERLARLLAAYAGKVKADIYGWAELNDGGMLLDLNRRPEALKIYQRIAGDANYPANRRAEAAVGAVDILMDSSPKEALTLAQSVSALPDGSTSDLENRMVRLLLTVKDSAATKTYLEGVVRAAGADAETRLVELLQWAERWKAVGDSDRVTALTKIVSELAPTPGDALRDALTNTREHTKIEEVKTRFVAALKTEPLVNWAKPVEGDGDRSPAAYDEEITKANKADDSVLGLQLCLRVLQAHPEDEFPKRLWRAATYAEWAERAAKDKVPETVCTTLIALCDDLPHSNDYYLEGRLLQAVRDKRRDHRTDERQIYQDLLRGAQMRPGYTVSVTERMGLSYEADRDFAQAAATYRLAERYLAKFPSACDQALREALIALQLGNDDDAHRILKLLADVPETTIKETENRAPLQELVALEKSGHAAEYWKQTRQWWPQWQAFARSVGLESKDIDVATPLIPDLGALGKSLGITLREGTEADFWRGGAPLASAARWQPSLAGELGALPRLFGMKFRAHLVSYRETVLPLLAVSCSPETGGWRERKLWLAAHLVDSDRPADANAAIRDFEAVKHPIDSVAVAVHRIKAVVALQTGKDVAESATVLEADLRELPKDPTRANTVWMLISLYEKLGRSDDARALVTTELKNPVTSEGAMAGELREWVKAQEGHDAFAAALSKWRQAFQPPWYDQAEPKSLDNPRLRNLESILRTHEGPFAPAEWVKIDLLAAQASSRTLEDRRTSLATAVLGMMTLAKRGSAVAAIARSFVDEPAFGEEQRFIVLWSALSRFAAGDPARYAEWRKHPLCATADRRSLVLLDEGAAMDRNSPDAIVASISRISQSEITSVGLDEIENRFDALLDLGALAPAHTVVQGISDWNLGAQIKRSREAIQLEYTRKLQQVQSLNPVHEALRQLVRTECPAVGGEPVEFADYLTAPGIPLLSPDAVFKFCRHRLETGVFSRTSFDFWDAFLTAVADRPNGNALVKKIVVVSLQAAPDDATRADLAKQLSFRVDLDDPDLRVAFFAALKPYRDAAKFPQTYAVIRIAEAITTLRQGGRVAPEVLLSDMADSEAQQFGVRLRLQTYLVQKNLVELKRAVTETDPGVLLSPRMMDETFRAYRMLQMKSEKQLAAAAILRQLRLAVVTSWASGDGKLGVYAARLALLLGDTTLLPPRWVDSMRTDADDVSARHAVVMIKAALDQNWPDVERESAVLVRDFPRWYENYWLRGQALHHLGRDKEAAEALKVYTHYALDEADYPEAVAMLEEITAVKPPPPVAQARK